MDGTDSIPILLIDDNPEDAELYTRGLELEGFYVQHVARVHLLASALRATTARALVFHLSGLFTWEICRHVCEMVDVPVVIVTARVRPDGANRARARRLDVAAFVAQPCPPPRLAEIIRRVLSGERGIEISRYT